jgi:hypothetical protein
MKSVRKCKNAKVLKSGNPDQQTTWSWQIAAQKAAVLLYFRRKNA